MKDLCDGGISSQVRSGTRARKSSMLGWKQHTHTGDITVG